MELEARSVIDVGVTCSDDRMRERMAQRVGCRVWWTEEGGRRKEGDGAHCAFTISKVTLDRREDSGHSEQTEETEPSSWMQSNPRASVASSLAFSTFAGPLSQLRCVLRRQSGL